LPRHVCQNRRCTTEPRLSQCRTSRVCSSLPREVRKNPIFAQQSHALSPAEDNTSGVPSACRSPGVPPEHHGKAWKLPPS
jgi:hypothetical protein